MIVVGRNDLRRQAEVLLNLAKTEPDPKLAAALVQMAADLQSHIDENMPSQDRSPQAGMPRRAPDR